MPAPIVSKEEVLRRLTEAFRRVGFDGATLALLARETGLKKASLYHYFPGGKKEMAEAALTEVGTWLQDEVFAHLEADQEPVERLRAMAESLDRFYQSGQKWCLVDLFSVGEAGGHFREVLKTGLQTWLDRLQQVAEQAGIPPEVARRRAEETLMVIQGGLVLSRAMDRPALFERVLSEIPDRMLQGGP